MVTGLWAMPDFAAHWMTLRTISSLTLAAWRFLPPLASLSPTNMLDPAGTPARSIFNLTWFVGGLVLGIFVVVGGLLTFIVLRYRGRATDDNIEPTQIYGSNQIELSWTVIPILLVFMLFLTTARVILGTERIPKPAGALDVAVIGHQFWWEYRYPSLGVVTANELHVPVSDPAHPTPTYLNTSSADVTHNFSVPRLAGRIDVIPNRVNTIWIDPQAAGLYLGQCAQYCGTQHAKMLLRVYADSPADFSAWIQHQQAPAADPSTLSPQQLEGKSVFEHNACANCHTVKGTSAQGKFGPDLTHMGSRDTLGSGAFANNRQNLHQWIDNPDSLKPGALMPPMHLNEKDLNAVTEYLTTLR
ncbi:Cytochrome c oxidase polypeptide II [Acidisarcina polymorpha]|uniref:Cytochrome c oxidase subunit 2 n=1 Tax=Acidisarcina polymorpha TaxID=2211140 RepID=A0A2Z5G910_9BACT|nr:cytochrome c oxidase subunit II [Acidisarcina polymorpha]AXC15036.1 Cytochrome c oxidase polypeptide II [Acidisarcina polymorpha]